MAQSVARRDFDAPHRAEKKTRHANGAYAPSPAVAGSEAVASV